MKTWKTAVTLAAIAMAIAAQAQALTTVATSPVDNEYQGQVNQEMGCSVLNVSGSRLSVHIGARTSNGVVVIWWDKDLDPGEAYTTDSIGGPATYCTFTFAAPASAVRAAALYVDDTTGELAVATPAR